VVKHLSPQRPHPTARVASSPRRRVKPHRDWRGLITIGVGALLMVSVIAGYFLVSPRTNAAAQDSAQLSSPAQQSDPSLTTSPLSTTTVAPTTTLPVAPATVAVPVTQSDPQPDLLELYQVTIIGDSLVVQADKQLRAALAPALVSVVAEEAIGLAEAQVTLAQQGLQFKKSDIVVVALGSADFDLPAGYELMVRGALSHLSGAHCVVWVDAQEISGRLPEINDAIDNQVSRVANAYLARWSSIAGNAALHPDSSYNLNDEGARSFASLVSDSVRENCL
jgi:hypothetical protein